MTSEAQRIERRLKLLRHRKGASGPSHLAKDFSPAEKSPVSLASEKGGGR